MSGRTITRFMLACDGCGCEFGAAGEYESSVETRAAAYGAGWRFPARVNRDGNRSSRQVSDVCPECLPSFEAEPSRGRQPRGGDAR